MAELKHFGKITSTGARVVVVVPQLPGKETHALVVRTESLPSRLKDSFEAAVSSTEAQQSDDLAQVLARKKFPDSRDMMNGLHQDKKLETMAIEHISLITGNYSSKPLVEALKQSGNYQDTAIDFHQPEEDPVDIAKSKLTQAELLEHDVKQLREEAYKLDPSLRPKTKSSTKKETEKAQ